MEIYKQALAHYFRRGVPVRMSLKEAAHPTTHYIWRTQSDGTVRASHAVNNGKIFAWNDPPATGHPGEDWGCRCVAEAYYPERSEFVNQEFITTIHDHWRQWTNGEFTWHFYHGNGATVYLSEAGHFQSLIDYYFYDLGRYEAINVQIINEARKHPTGNFSYNFGRSYDFGTHYLFVLGGATVHGVFSGTVEHHNGVMSIVGTINYLFNDVFTDPLSDREEVIGTSDPMMASPRLLEETEYGGQYYTITGAWRTRFTARAYHDSARSLYR